MNADQRLFDYGLEPQLQRLRWRLDEELGAVARRAEALEQLRAQCDTIEGQATAAAQETTRQQAARIDPLRARHSLDFLAALHQHRTLIDAEMRRNQAALAEAREALARTQREIEKLEADRRDLLADHLCEVDRRQLREADQDWIARAAWRMGVDAPLEERS